MFTYSKLFSLLKWGSEGGGAVSQLDCLCLVVSISFVLSHTCHYKLASVDPVVFLFPVSISWDFYPWKPGKDVAG